MKFILVKFRGADMDKSLVYLVGWYQIENGKNQETGKACLSWH